MKIAVQAGTLLVRASPEPPWTAWASRKLLPEIEAQTMMSRFLASQLTPLPLPKARDQWLARRDGLRSEIMSVLGIDDLVPPKWDLALKSQGTLRRNGYRIEKLTFESYPGMAIPALLYIPEGITGRVPGMWAMDLVQAARFCRDKFSAPSVSLEAENSYGWSALLAGAAAPDLIASGSVEVPWASLHDDIRTRGDQALADVPGLLERLDIAQLRALWSVGHVSVKH